MKWWDIWCGPAWCQEGVYPASQMGSARGITFVDACETFFRQRAETSSDGYRFDPKSMTFWACRVCDNESEARIGE